jgi:5-formyltetrahydrofolate cyclo-ligase
MNISNLSKPQWRVEIKQRLAALTPEQYQTYNQQLETAFFSLHQVGNAKTILMYYSVRREVMTLALIEKMLASGKRVALPICTAERNLEAKAITGLDKVVETGKFGLKEPVNQAPRVAVTELDLVVVPGVAFDETGHRLGHGMGYYDRFLRQAGLQAAKVGLAYDFQVVPNLPADQWDVKMNALLTPSRLLNFD